MAEGVVHRFDADHGFGLIRPDRDGELLHFSVDSVLDEHVGRLVKGSRVRFEVAVGQAGKQAVRVTSLP